MVAVEEKREIGPEEGSGHPTQTSYRFKLAEILKNLHSPELVIYSESSKDFIYFLRGHSGGEVLCEYVQLSPKCAEILEAWKLHTGKPGMSFILSLLSVILSHSAGRSQSSIGNSLDSVARFIIEYKLDDIYAELNNHESRRQSAALSLLASIVRRRMGLASEVAKRFDFKLPILSKLCGVHKKRAGKDFKPSKRLSTRRAFVEFAMSFLEVGNPRLLRWILQQRDVYYGVLRSLASDDTDTIINVLSILHEKLLKEDSLVPPGLRSVLFGSATLEQLSIISGNPLAGPAADIAHDVLVAVCTDPQNGLMPGPGLKGNKKRLLDFMKKLRATEVAHHKQLLLAIVKKEGYLCSAYLDEFPYHLEPHPSSSWFSAISLAAELISNINIGSTITSNLCDRPGTEVPHEILNCIIPRAFTRSMINKGLLHSDDIVKHGSLRLVLELLKSLDGLLASLDTLNQRTIVRQEAGFCVESMASMHNLPSLNYIVHVDEHSSDGGIASFPFDEVIIQNWVALKHYIQNEIRAVLPDPQVLLKLVSSSSALYSGIGVKRSANFPGPVSKKLKLTEVGENIDILICGMDSPLTNDIAEDSIKMTPRQILEAETDHFSMIYEIWGLPEKKFDDKSKDANSFFQSKLFDVLKIYLRAMPIAFEGSFDFFKLLPANPSSLSIDQQRSLLCLLAESIKQSSGNRISAGMLYKHLHPLINFLIFSQVEDIKSQAYTLVRAVMINTGAFDQNLSEIDSWFVFLPGSINNINVGQSKELDTLYNQSAIVVSFLCEAVSTIGNNLYKYLDQMRKLLSEIDVNDHSVCLSPLIICVLQKCLRLLGSDSENLKLNESSLISLYVGNTLSLIMHSQVDMITLPSLIYVLLHEIFEDHPSVDENPRHSLCEWRPLRKLFGFACKILDEQVCISHSVSGCNVEKSETSLYLVLAEVKELLRQAQGGRVDGLATALTSSILCAAHDDILTNLPSILAIMHLCFPSHLPFLSSVFFQEPKFLVRVRELWPRMFSSGLEMIIQEVEHCYGDFGYVFSSNESIMEAKLDSMELSTSAFCSFLKHSPFYVLLSSVLSFATWESDSTGTQDIFPLNRMQELLKVKISEGSIDGSILNLKYVLFWSYHMFLLYKEKQSYVISELLLMCITLVQDLMDHLLAVISDQDGLKVCFLPSVGQYVQIIAELIFCHPIVTLYISNPLYFSRRFTNGTFGISIDSFLTTFKQNIHSVDLCMLQLLRKFFGFWLALSRAISSSDTIDSVLDSLISAKSTLVQNILLSFREKFEQLVASKHAGPFLPTFYILQSLIDFILLFDLLELVHWMFGKIESNMSGGMSSLEQAVSVSLYIANISLDKLCSLLQDSTSKLKSDILLEAGFRSFDCSLVPKIFYKILDFSLCFHLKLSDICLLKVVNVVYNHRCLKPSTVLHPLHVLLSSMVSNVPVKMLMYYIYCSSKIKAKALLLLTEISPVHLNLFGKMFLAILDNSPSSLNVSNAGFMQPCRGKRTSNSKYCLSNDEFLLLLPAALSYFISAFEKHGEQSIQPFMKIPLAYANILLDGFSTWDVFVSQEIFQEDYDEFLPISLEEFNKFCCSSLIGNAVAMLHYFFVLDGSSIRWKRRLELFDSICPQSSFFDGHFSCGSQGLDACSYKEYLKVINKVVAKISFMRLLVFSPECSSQSMIFLDEASVKFKVMEKESGQLNDAKLRLMNILLNTLDQIFKQFPLRLDGSVDGCATHCYGVFRLLENFILKEIVWLLKKMHSYSIEISSFSFVNRFIRSSLLHRFEDHFTLKAIRCILVSLSGSKFSFLDVLELLIGHSAFVKIIISNLAISSDSSIFASCGTLLQPLSSVLKLVDVYDSVQNICHIEPSSKEGLDCYSVEYVKLELVRLLRILFHLKDRNTITNCFNSRELLSLLLCGYSATKSQIDLEIFHLMHEIESVERQNTVSMAALDYMWGVAAMKVRNDKTHDVLLPSNTTSACETTEERKIHFRENILVDSKVCAVTVLHLCNDRSSRVLVSLESLLEDTSISFTKISASSGKDVIQPYDPSFILQFSFHSLSMGYLEPVEFSRLGLLAVTFASLSSSDENIRKLGYECLGRFKICLENSKKSKDFFQLLLLLTYLQNGITKEWQEIPSVFAIFAAEASFTLLDYSQNHFITITKFLMRFPRVNFKVIPLFHTLFGSSPVHFRTDCLWILRLLYAGLNSPSDAKLYFRNNVLDALLSYSSSSLADDEVKILILMIVKRFVQFHVVADCLVKEFGLLPWLSSLLLFYGERLIGHQEGRSSVDILKLIVEIVNDLVSSSMISEWLQDYALEHLSEFSLLVLELFVGNVKFLKEDISLVRGMLIVITSTVKLSQKRNIYQPHFILSLESLFQLFQAVSVTSVNFGYIIELGIDAILMNTPAPCVSHVHKEILIKLLTWTTPAVLWSNVNKKFATKDRNSALFILPGEEQIDESLASKLLRWVSASVILGPVISNQSEISTSSNISGKENMLAYLKMISTDATKNSSVVNDKNSSVVNESLAVLILHLQDLLSRKCVFLSVVAALCALLLSAASSGEGTLKKYVDDNYGTIQSLCSKIRFPTETNPAWRWSFDQPWKDLSVNKSEMELMEEEHACQSLLMIFSNAVGVGNAQGFPALRVEDVENCGLHQWEKETFVEAADNELVLLSEEIRD